MARDPGGNFGTSTGDLRRIMNPKYKFNSSKYEEIAKNMLGESTPYNPPDRSYYLELGRKARIAKDAAKAKDNDILAKYGISTSDDGSASSVKADDYYTDFENGTDEDANKVTFGDDLKAAGKAALQFFNPFDDVSGKEAVQNYLNRDTSKAFDELARGSNRAVDSASFGAMSNLDKKVLDRNPYYNSQREWGEGKGTDMITSGLGYLVPGVGVYKALNATKAGKTLTNFGNAGLKQRLASEAGKGAIAGGAMSGAEIGIREGLNPEDTNFKDNLTHLGLGVGLGAVADPALYGVGQAALRGLSRFAKGDVPTFTGQPSENVVNSLPNSRASQAGLDKLRNSTPTQSGDFYERLSNLARPKGEMLPADNLAMANRARQAEVNAYNQEFNNAVERQFQYLKDSMGKGVQPGGLVRDQEGYVINAYGRVSNNPKWYQDFYAQNGRKPNNQELRDLAEIHVREGFQDELGSLPPWQPKAVQEIDDQLDELTSMAMSDPTQEPALRPIIEALEQEKSDLLKSYENITSSPVAATSEPSLARIANNEPPLARAEEPSLSRISANNQPLRAGRDYEPIEANPNNVPMTRLREGETPIDRTPMEINNPKEIVIRQIDSTDKRPKTKFSFDKFMTQWVDDLRPLDKATRDLGGKDLPFDQNPYTQARLARGVAGKAETYLRGGIFDGQGNKIGKSLQEIIKPIENKMDDFLAYSASKRALDYDKKGLTAGIKPKDVEGFNDYQLADAAIRQIEAESPEIKAIHQELVNYNNRLMDELMDAGVLDEATVLSLRQDNPNYIPMFRVQEPKVRGFEPLTNQKRKYANLGEPFKTRTGSEKPIINPIESIVKNTYLTLNMAERNKVGRSLLELAEQADDNMWVRVVDTDKGLSVDDVGQALDNANAQLNDGNADAIDNLFKGEDNKVYVYKDGQRVEMEVQEDLYKSLLSLDTQKQNFIIKFLSAPTRALRTGAVLSPDFGPVNIFRDQLSAFVNSKYGFIPFVDMAKGLKDVVRSQDVRAFGKTIIPKSEKSAATYWQWKDAGGANSVLSTLDREYLQQDLRKMVKQTMGQKVKNAAKHPLKTVLEPLRKVSEITEEATRLGEYKKGLKKGASPKEAAFASRDLIDFARAGTLGRQYNQVTAFFNAAVQSMDKLARTFKENKYKASLKALTSITIPSLVAYYYNKDQEWYKEIPQRERDLYWHFQVDDQIYKLPKPFEAGIIFGTSFERMLDYMETDDPEAWKGFGKTVRDAFTPSWMPTAIAPWWDVYANRSMYFDSPIVPRREQDLLPEDQFGPYQSEASKFVGKIANQSPRKIEHVFKGYTGGLGKYALQISDFGAEMLGKERPELPDRGLADLPIVNRFVVKNLEGSNQSINDFYERMDKLRRENLSAKKNNPDHENTEVYKDIQKMSREISELQAAKRAIIDDPNMTGEEKTAQIRQIDYIITQIAKVGNQLSE
jgi:hypothetical protein